MFFYELALRNQIYLTNMKLKIYTFITCLIFPFFLNAQSPNVSWQLPFGGSGSEGMEAIRQLPDGGYIFAGGSNSGTSGNKTVPNRGDFDYWMVRTDANGESIWQSVAGGTGRDVLHDLNLTQDGGFIMGGESNSPISNEKTAEPIGGLDFWIVKMNFAGEVEWDKTIGGTEAEVLETIEQTADGGYILGGISFSGISGDKTEAAYGEGDLWIVKLDSLGNIEWDKSLGGENEEELFHTQQTSDGGYIVGSYSMSGISGNKTDENKGWADYWLVKLSSTGSIEWQKSYGGTDYDFLLTLQQTADDGYIFAGQSDSPNSGDKSADNHGGSDFWIVKTDATGEIEWEKTIGGDADDIPNCLTETHNGGFIIGGTSDSGISGDKTDIGTGQENSWIVMLDALGNVVWDKTVGTDLIDDISSIEQTSDRGYILGGFTGFFTGSGDGITNYGLYDFFVVKLEGCAPTTGNEILEVCNEYTDPNGELYNVAGSYNFTYSIENSVGCDSMISVDLTVEMPSNISIVETACDEYMTPNGETVTQSGMITEVIEGGNISGCDSTVMIDLTIVNLDLTVTQNDSAFVANENNAQYVWLDCSTGLAVEGASSQTFKPSESGNYAVVIYKDGCSKTSECLTFVETVGVRDKEFETEVLIFPNPTSDKVWIDLGRNYEGVTIHVNNLLGQKIKSEQFETVQKMELDWEGETGVYFIQIESKTGEKTSVKILRI